MEYPTDAVNRNPEAELARREPSVRRALSMMNEILLECDRFSMELLERTSDIRRIEPHPDETRDSPTFGVELADNMVPMLETAKDVRERLRLVLDTLEV